MMSIKTKHHLDLQQHHVFTTKPVLSNLRLIEMDGVGMAFKSQRTKSKGAVLTSKSASKSEKHVATMSQSPINKFKASMNNHENHF